MSGTADPGGDLARLYRDAIRRHSSDPVGYRRDIGATHRHEEYNPQCGDRIEVLLRMQHHTVEAAAFDGEACAICMASASMLCSLAPGRTVDELRAFGDGLHEALTGESDANASRLKPLLQPLLRPPSPHAPLHPDLLPLLGVRPYPSRVGCATLPWAAAKRALSA